MSKFIKLKLPNQTRQKLIAFAQENKMKKEDLVLDMINSNLRPLASELLDFDITVFDLVQMLAAENSFSMKINKNEIMIRIKTA